MTRPTRTNVSSSRTRARHGRAAPRRTVRVRQPDRAIEPGVRLFGQPAVRVRGGWMPLRPGKTAALVTYVAHRGAPVRRAELAALLWPELDERRAHTNLRQLLRGLALGPFRATIERERDVVRAAFASDLTVFERAVEEARWADAVAWYQGPFLDGFEVADAGDFGSWVVSERAVAEGRWRQASLALLDEIVAEGRYAFAEHLADRLLHADPLDEVALRHALRAAAAHGDTHGARQRYQAFCEALRREVGMAPEAATVQLGDELLATPSPASAAATRHDGSEGLLRYGRRATDVGAMVAPQVRGLPRLVGRERTLSDLVAVLERDDVRLLTLLAPGGMGKTSLALALAEALAGRFADGVVVAPLDGLDGPEAVAHALAGAAGVSLGRGGATAAQVTAALAQRNALVVLDGFEQHLDQIALINGLVRAGPHLTFVVTSRTRLRLSSEVVFELAPLSTAPPTVATQAHAEVAPSDAARLFLRAAARVTGRPPSSADDLALVERVCSAVGGNPLAIELVAAWLDVLPLVEVERQLASSWQLLRSEDVDRAPERSDLEAAIGATWQQLDAADRLAWARLAVLPGSLDRTVAAAVAGTGWRGLRRLADRAVVRHRGERLELHALLARFGRERATEGRHIEAAWEAALTVWRERIAVEVDAHTGLRVHVHDHDLDQVLGVWHWALGHERWEDLSAIAVGFLRALARAGRVRDVAGATSLAVERLTAGRGRTRDAALARTLPFVPAPAVEAEANARRALALAEALGDDRAIACATAALLRAAPAEDAAARFARARAAYERSGDAIGVAQLLLDRGEALVLAGALEEGEAHVREALAAFVRLGDRLGQAHAHDVAATGPLLRGEVAAARAATLVAQALFDAEGAVYRGSGALAREVWLALESGPRVEAEERMEAYLAREAGFGDASLVAALVRSALHARYGEHREVAEQARLVLRHPDVGDRPALIAVMAHQRLARALVALGALEEAVPQLRRALEMTRALRAPRFVARVVQTAGALALERCQSGVARAFLLAAWRHPAFEHALREETRELLERLGEPVPDTASRRGALESVGSDDDALLLEVEGSLRS